MSEKLPSFDTILSLQGAADGGHSVRVTTHTGVTAFLDPRGKDIHRRMCLCTLVSGAAFPYQPLTILKTFLPITLYYTDLNLYLPDYFI